MLGEKMGIKLDFNKARTFIEVVDCGTITMAANRLLRTQQAISLQLHQLEDDLELCLFDRNGPKITLTIDGQILYQQFKQQLLAMEHSVLTLKSEKQKASGTIRIGAWMEQAVNYLPEMMRIFKQRFPLVEFTLHIAEDIEIEKMLADNVIDVGLQVFIQDKKMFKTEPVYSQPLIPVISRLFAQKHAAVTSLIETLSLPLLDYGDEYSAYNTWVKKNARELLPDARKKVRTITTTNNVVLKQLVLQGLGFGFLHLDSIQAELDIGELQPLINRPNYQNVTVAIDMVYKRKATLGYVHQEFIKLLQENMASWKT